MIKAFEETVTRVKMMARKPAMARKVITSAGGVARAGAGLAEATVMTAIRTVAEVVGTR